VLHYGAFIRLLPAERKMDHLYIEEHNIADCYLMGRLSAEEQRRFEEHFLGCQRCRSWLETTHHFRTGLQSVFASGEAEFGVYLQACDRQSTAERDELAAQLERERESRAPQDDRRERASLSHDDLSIFALSTTRGANSDLSEPANRIVLSPRSELGIFCSSWYLNLIFNLIMPSSRPTITRKFGVRATLA